MAGELVVSTDLMAEVKNHLDITWNDGGMETKLEGIILRGMVYLNDITNREIDYMQESRAKALLLSYCMYDRSGALNDFYENYSKELLAIQINSEVEEYETTEATV